MSMKACSIVFIVEGSTEKYFFDLVLNNFNYKRNFPKIHFEIINIQGVGKFEARGVRKYECYLKKLKNKYGQEIPSYVYLCYDHDVFVRNAKPPFDFNKIKKKLETYPNTKKVEKVIAYDQIEDWFLLDLAGICKYLGISKTNKKVNGRSGTEKMINLFKKAGNKTYQKRQNLDGGKFIDSMDFKKITSQLTPFLQQLDDICKNHT